jgi:hypothetical protein
MLVFFRVILNIFDCGMMDLFKILQQFLDRLYIRHREYDELVHNTESSNAVLEEMKRLVEDLPEYKLLFLSPTVKDALLRVSTWIVTLLNYIDNQAVLPGESLVYCLPNILIDIPFEVFRVFKRSNQDLYESKGDGQNHVYNGCLSFTTYQS